MTHPPDDRDLVDFLRQHHPIPPPASPALKSAILHSVAPSPPRQVLPWWMAIPPMVAAAAIALWLWPSPPPTYTTADLQDIEEYLLASWFATTDETLAPLTDWLADDPADVGD